MVLGSLVVKNLHIGALGRRRGWKAVPLSSRLACSAHTIACLYKGSPWQMTNPRNPERPGLQTLSSKNRIAHYCWGKGQVCFARRLLIRSCTGSGISSPPNYPLLYPKYPLVRAIWTLLKGPWGVGDFQAHAMSRGGRENQCASPCSIALEAVLPGRGDHS